MMVRNSFKMQKCRWIGFQYAFRLKMEADTCSPAAVSASEGHCRRKPHGLVTIFLGGSSIVTEKEQLLTMKPIYVKVHLLL
jgi:hypothetical protein